MKYWKRPEGQLPLQQSRLSQVDQSMEHGEAPQNKKNQATHCYPKYLKKYVS